MNNNIIMEEELRYKALKVFLPRLLITYNLEELYKENPLAAMEKVCKELEDKNHFLNKKNMLLVVNDFDTQKNKFIDLLKDTSEEIFESNKDMYLFKAVSIFENTINNKLHEELEFRVHIVGAKSDKILRKLSIEDKLDWFLKLLCGESFIQQEEWGIIKRVIKARNFFIHPKPSDMHEHHEQQELLNKEILYEFMEASTACFIFLESLTAPEVIEYNQKIEELAALIKKPSTL